MVIVCSRLPISTRQSLDFRVTPRVAKSATISTLAPWRFGGGFPGGPAEARAFVREARRRSASAECSRAAVRLTLGMVATLPMAATPPTQNSETPAGCPHLARLRDHSLNFKSTATRFPFLPFPPFQKTEIRRGRGRRGESTVAGIGGTGGTARLARTCLLGDPPLPCTCRNQPDRRSKTLSTVPKPRPRRSATRSASANWLICPAASDPYFLTISKR
jgi:hypothetical protein